MAEIIVSGVYQLKQRIAKLKTAVRDRGMKSSVRAGGEKIAEAARANAARIDDPKTPENIAANISVQAAPKLGRSHGGYAVRIGVIGGARKSGKGGGPGGDTWYWRFLELGTSKMAARPFLRPAADTKAETAVEEVATRLEQFLDRTVPTL